MIDIIVIAIILSICIALQLDFIPSAIVSTLVCQFPLLGRAFNPKFRGYIYIITMEICVVAIALGTGYLFD